jgi:glycosyltransferase involved in cell wall biosynthesis
MTKISAAIICFNEERNIRRCIDSLVPVADEIVVVDSFSTDKTESICREYDIVKFVQNPFEGHVQQKNYALSLTSYDYVISLDADECLDEKLQKKVLEVKKDLKFDAYSFNRITRYVDHWVRYCGWYPDKKVRFFNKNKAKWGGDNPHDHIILEKGASLKHISSDILHYSYDSISDHVTQTNKFTTIAAKHAFAKGKKSSFLTIVVRSFFKFFRDYVLKLGFLDGRYGFVICYINSTYALLKYAKLKDLERGQNID